jgi:hypothetical protein
MPSIASRTVALPSNYTASETKSVTPTRPYLDGTKTAANDPTVNPLLRSPLPPIFVSPDSLRQFFAGGSVPQIRMIPPSSLVQPL